MSPVIRRPCPGCKVALIAAPARRCLVCATRHEQARGSATRRGLGSAYQQKREFILRRDGWVCWLCGQDGADTVDHVIPRSRGGESSDDNLRAAHRSCNARRGAR